jgi:hypothetical protein
MSLNKSALADALTKLFNNAQEQSWSKDKVASELANAIETYVLGADVTGVMVQVTGLTDPATNKVTGSGTQTGNGKIQ